jgi:hypothetical protein
MEGFMKKLPLFALILILAAGAVFGEDAKTMPKMVGRLWLAPTFAFAPGGYDTDGDYESFGSGEKSLKMFNLGFALEYGIIDWITAAIQWAPGVNVWSDVDYAIPLDPTGTVVSDSSVNVDGVADLFVGAKFQIAGAAAPLKTDRLRFAIGPGVKIPLPGPDFEDQMENVLNNDPVTAENLDKHVFGVGARVYFDYIFNEHFFINLYNETIFYPIEGDIEDSSLTGYGTLATFKAMGVSDLEGKVNYGYDLTFELEPVFSTSLGSGITFTAGLPVNYSYTPAYSYSISTNVPGAESQVEDALENDPSHTLKVKPNVNFFFTSWFLPTEIGLTYAIPVWGKSTLARHEITLKVKLYFALPGAR